MTDEQVLLVLKHIRNGYRAHIQEAFEKCWGQEGWERCVPEAIDRAIAALTAPAEPKTTRHAIAKTIEKLFERIDADHQKDWHALADEMCAAVELLERETTPTSVVECEDDNTASLADHVSLATRLLDEILVKAGLERRPGIVGDVTWIKNWLGTLKPAPAEPEPAGAYRIDPDEEWTPITPGGVRVNPLAKFGGERMEDRRRALVPQSEDDSLTMPIEQVRDELQAAGIDTQPIKDYVHAKLSELRAEKPAPAACQHRELLQLWLVEWQTGLLPRRDLIEDVRAALAQPCAPATDAGEWELDEARVYGSIGYLDGQDTRTVVVAQTREQPCTQCSDRDCDHHRGEDVTAIITGPTLVRVYRRRAKGDGR